MPRWCKDSSNAYIVSKCFVYHYHLLRRGSFPPVHFLPGKRNSVRPGARFGEWLHEPEIGKGWVWSTGHVTPCDEDLTLEQFNRSIFPLVCHLPSGQRLPVGQRLSLHLKN